MVTIATAKQVALSLPEAEEFQHFHLRAFRVRKKVFASIHEDKNYMMIKLSPLDQSVFCAFDKEIVFPVPGGWGRKGATFFNLKKVKRGMLADAITLAWKTAAPRKLVEQLKS